MKKNLPTTLLAVASFATFASLATAQVTLIQENFDNYGTVLGSLATQNGGTGFSGAWTQTGIGTHGYNPTNLTATVTGYTNTGDAAGGNDGAASNNTYNGGLGNFNSTRAIAQPTIANGGTVWFSFTVNMASIAAQNNAVFSPFGTGGGDMFNTGKFSVGVSGGSFFASSLVSYTPGTPNTNVVNNTFTGAAISANTTYLIVGRMTIDAAANATDILDVWFNPSNVSSIASLGAAQLNFTNQDFSTANTPDPNRTSGSSGVFLNGITVGIRGTDVNKLDAIRLAYGDTTENNFASVIPEPSTSGLILLGAVGLLLQRRRSLRD